MIKLEFKKSGKNVKRYTMSPIMRTTNGEKSNGG